MLTSLSRNRPTTVAQLHQPCPRDLPLAALVATCRQDRHGEGDGRFALELFSRAIRDRDDLAWAAVIEEFSELVGVSIRRHPTYPMIAEDYRFLVSRTFQRFMLAVRPDQLDQFTSFGAIVCYLKMCGLSVLIDEVRRQGRRQHVSFEELGDQVDSGIDVDGRVIAALDAKALWHAVIEELPDETDRLVARLSYQYAYKPREIYTRHPNQIASVAEVYRRKRNIIARLRRSQKVRYLVVSACET